MKSIHRLSELELRHVRLVRAVIQTGNLSAAARRLSLTPSALSHQLRIAEEICGPLFVRAGRQMIPTRAGRSLGECAEDVERALERAAEELQALACGSSDVVRISTECHTTYNWFPRVIPELERRFPGVEVRVVTEATRDPLQALVRGELDLALSTEVEPDAALCARPLFGDELVLLVPPSHRLAGRKRVRPEAASGEPLYLFESVSTERATRRFPALARLVPSRVQRMPLTDSILDLVCAGQGISIMPKLAALRALAERQLVAVSLSPRLLRRWYAVSLAGDERPQLVELVRLLAERAAPRA